MLPIFTRTRFFSFNIKSICNFLFAFCGFFCSPAFSCSSPVWTLARIVLGLRNPFLDFSSFLHIDHKVDQIFFLTNLHLSQFLTDGFPCFFFFFSLPGVIKKRTSVLFFFFFVTCARRKKWKSHCQVVHLVKNTRREKKRDYFGCRAEKDRWRLSSWCTDAVLTSRNDQWSDLSLGQTDLVDQPLVKFCDLALAFSVIKYCNFLPAFPF